MSDLKVDLQDFLKQWPLGAIVSTREVLNGAVNRVYRLETSIGIFFLRLYKTKDRSVIEREHHILENLAANNLPAIQTLPSRYGSSIVAIDGQYGALYFQSPGHQVQTKDLTKTHARAAGEMLAHIHKALKPLKENGHRKYSLKWDAQEWILDLSHIEEVIYKKSDKDAFDKLVLSRLEAQKKWLQNPECPHEYVPQFESQVLHGDFHQGNLFFQKETICGIIDWDQSTYMPRAFEVVRASSYMFNLQVDLTRVFLEAYQSINPLSHEELQDGARAWGCHCDHYIWAAEEIYLKGNHRARVFIPEAPFEAFKIAWGRL